MSVAANELIHGVDEDVEFLLGIRMEFSQVMKAGLHAPSNALEALGQTDFGLGYPADQVRDGRNRRLRLGKPLFVPLGRSFKPGEALIVLLGRSFQPHLDVQNELHGFFNVHRH